MTENIILEIIKTASAIISPLLVIWVSKKVNETDKKVTEVAIQTNGKMKELLDISVENGRRLGNQEGQQQRKEEQAPVNAANIVAAKAEGILEGKEQQKDIESKK